MTTEGKLIVLRGGPLSGCATTESGDYWYPQPSEIFKENMDIPRYTDSGETEIWSGIRVRVFEFSGLENVSSVERKPFERHLHKDYCKKLRKGANQRTLWEF